MEFTNEEITYTLTKIEEIILLFFLVNRTAPIRNCNEMQRMISVFAWQDEGIRLDASFDTDLEFPYSETVEKSFDNLKSYGLIHTNKYRCIEEYTLTECGYIIAHKVRADIEIDYPLIEVIKELVQTASYEEFLLWYNVAVVHQKDNAHNDPIIKDIFERRISLAISFFNKSGLIDCGAAAELAGLFEDEFIAKRSEYLKDIPKAKKIKIYYDIGYDDYDDDYSDDDYEEDDY